MKRYRLYIMLLLILLAPKQMYAQFAMDTYGIEAYINDHKVQRSLLLVRSTLEESNQMLHSYSKTETVNYKDINKELDKYTRAFDIIDILYQSLRTALNVRNTYNTVSNRIGDYKDMLSDFNDKIVSRGAFETADTLILTVNYHAIERIADECDNLYKSVNDLVLYATGAAACTTSDLILVLDNINASLDNIKTHINKAYFDTWRYIQVRIGFWKQQVYRSRTIKQMADDAFSRWRQAGYPTRQE